LPQKADVWPRPCLHRLWPVCRTIASRHSWSLQPRQQQTQQFRSALACRRRLSPHRSTRFCTRILNAAEDYAGYLQQNGFKVDVKPTNDLSQIRHDAGVPEQLEGRHTMLVDGMWSTVSCQSTSSRSCFRSARPSGKFSSSAAFILSRLCPRSFFRWRARRFRMPEFFKLVGGGPGP
jgi:hypothetical protein